MSEGQLLSMRCRRNSCCTEKKSFTVQSSQSVFKSFLITSEMWARKCVFFFQYSFNCVVNVVETSGEIFVLAEHSI